MEAGKFAQVAFAEGGIEAGLMLRYDAEKRIVVAITSQGRGAERSQKSRNGSRRVDE